MVTGLRRTSGRTWIHLTAAGRKALHDEISQLKRLIRQVEEAPAADPAPSTGPE
jgi:hypothetical protein